MDGVLVDFIGGASEAIGFHWDDKETARARKLDNEGKFTILNNTTTRFWAELKPLPDAYALWNGIKHHDPFILSTPSKYMPTCIAEKKEWIRRHLKTVPENRIYLVPRDNKKNFAVIDRRNGFTPILIDDYHKNITEWESVGGTGIQHTSAANTLATLKGIGL